MKHLVFCIPCNALRRGVRKPSQRFRGENVHCEVCDAVMIPVVSPETARVAAL